MRLARASSTLAIRMAKDGSKDLGTSGSAHFQETEKDAMPHLDINSLAVHINYPPHPLQRDASSSAVSPCDPPHGLPSLIGYASAGTRLSPPGSQTFSQ